MPERRQLAFLESLAAERCEAQAVQLARARQALDAADKQLTVLRNYESGYHTQLGDKLGALLFQLPPNARKDLPLFEAFLADLPPGARAAFEFRHASWLDDEIFDRLRRKNLALCVADSEKMSARGGSYQRSSSRSRPASVGVSA